ncbi:hypothetical protein GOP47_0009002, partial [Adiantum capillus-veneris]
FTFKGEMTAQVCKGSRGRKNLAKTLSPCSMQLFRTRNLVFVIGVHCQGAMALLHRRKSFSVISRYRLCGRFYSSLDSGSVSSKAVFAGLSAPSSSTQIHSLRQLLPAMAVAMKSSLIHSAHSYTTLATCLGSRHKTSCCYTHKCTSECGCLCTSAGALCIVARNCTTTAYPPPASPGEYAGGVEEAEDGAPLDVEEAAGPPIGAQDFNMPPYDDSKYAEDDDGDYEDEDPPPDPEEKLLFSPSDED